MANDGAANARPAPLDAASPRASVGIRIAQMRKTYESFVALDSVDLDVRSGEFLTLLGPSGSGKTTLLMILAGFVRADSGSLRFDEREMITVPAHLRDVGMVFQSYALFPHMTVAQNVGYPLRVRKIGRPEIEERVHAALRLVQLAGLGGRKPAELSGGQRQRVALARSIVFEPRVLLMDEPLSALDKNLREAMQLEIRRLHDRLGVTTIYVTHDQREALTMSDRIVVMRNGRIVQTGTPREIYDQPRTAFVGRFVGESYMLPIDVRDGTPMVVGSPLVATRQPAYAPASRYSLLVRPERLRLLAPAARANRFPATLQDVVYQGDTALVRMTLPSGSELAMRLPASDRSLAELPRPGDQVVAYLDADDVIVVCDDSEP